MLTCKHERQYEMNSRALLAFLTNVIAIDPQLSSLASKN
jgi:hypothetical protein